jgi:hypothetical protein
MPGPPHYGIQGHPVGLKILPGEIYQQQREEKWLPKQAQSPNVGLYNSLLSNSNFAAEVDKLYDGTG